MGSGWLPWAAPQRRSWQCRRRQCRGPPAPASPSSSPRQETWKAEVDGRIVLDVLRQVLTVRQAVVLVWGYGLGKPGP